MFKSVVLILSLFLAINAHSEKKILLIGDSITFGQYSGDVASSWADIITEHYKGKYTIINAGLSGSSSYDWTTSNPSVWMEPYSKQGSIFNERALSNLPADVVFVMLGTNDSVGFMKPYPTSPIGFSLNMHELFVNLVKNGAKKIVVMLPPKRFYDVEDVDIRLLKYQKSILGYRHSFSEIVIGPNFYELMTPNHFEGIDVHPNKLGYEFMANEIIKFIDNNL